MTFIAFIQTSDPNSSIPDNIEDIYSMMIANPPYRLTLPLKELLAQNQGSDHPPRPQNAFILFRKDLVARLKGFNTDKPLSEWSNFSRFAKKVWKDLPDVAKQYFEVIALNYNKIHKKQYPNFKYSNKPKSDKKKIKRNTKRRIKSSKSNQYLDEEQLALILAIENFEYLRISKLSPNIDEGEQLTSIENFENLHMPEFSEFLSVLNMNQNN